MEARLISTALSGQLHAAPGASAARSSNETNDVMIAGATGRLGEAMVNAALRTQGLQRVGVWLQQPFAKAPPKLVGLDLEQWKNSKPSKSVILLPNVGHDGSSRLGNGRDAAYASLEPEALATILAGLDLRTSHVLLVHPTAAWQQIGAFQQGLAGPLEEQVAACGASIITIIRPVLSASSPSGSWLQRCVNAYLSLQLLMMPRSIPALTSTQIADACLLQLKQKEPGIRVIAATQLVAG
jgi:hypothetical protein